MSIQFQKDHPEIDSSHHNQAIAINDCLNQFKDAADFIVTGDWDDIFLTGFESKLGVGALGMAAKTISHLHFYRVMSDTIQYRASWYI